VAAPDDGFPPMPVEWALGCFVRFWEVDRGIPVTAMGATSTWPNLAESGMAGLDEPRAEAAFISDGRPVTLESENTLANGARINVRREIRENASKSLGFEGLRKSAI
jgi:hypothetical protein